MEIKASLSISAERWQSWCTSEWHLNLSTCLFFLEGTLHGTTLCSSLLTQENISTSVTMWLYVCVCACRRECHRLSLHGNDIPVSQTPARIIEGRRQRVSCFSKNGKNIRCWCTKKNQTYKEHTAVFAFFNHMGWVQLPVRSWRRMLTETIVCLWAKKVSYSKINKHFHIRNYT